MRVYDRRARGPRARRPARSCSARSTSVSASSTSTPGPRSSGCSSSASCRSSTRTTPSPTTRSASATTTGWPRSWPTSCRADLLVLLTDTPGLLTADPRLDCRGLAHRGDRRVRPRARGAWPGLRAAARGSGGMASKLAAAKIAAWSGRADGHRAGRPSERARRRGRRGGRRRHVRAPASPAPARPQAVDRVRGRLAAARSWWTTAPARPSSSAGCRCSRPASARSRARSTPTTRWRSPARTARSSPRASSASAPAALRDVAGRRTSELPDGVPHVVVHRDDLVVLP